MESPEVIRMIELLKSNLHIELNIDTEVDYGNEYKVVTAKLSFDGEEISQTTIPI